MTALPETTTGQYPMDPWVFAEGIGLLVCALALWRAVRWLVSRWGQR